MTAMGVTLSRKNKMRRRVWTNDSPFKIREAIRQHLLSEVNPHNTRMLELMDRKEIPIAGVEFTTIFFKFTTLYLVTQVAKTVLIMKLG